MVPVHVTVPVASPLLLLLFCLAQPVLYLEKIKLVFSWCSFRLGFLSKKNPRASITAALVSSCVLHQFSRNFFGPVASCCNSHSVSFTASSKAFTSSSKQPPVASKLSFSHSKLPVFSTQLNQDLSRTQLKKVAFCLKFQGCCVRGEAGTIEGDDV